MGKVVGIDQEKCDGLETQHLFEVEVDRLEDRFHCSILWDSGKGAIER
jgi:hypothetical protein